MANKYFETMYDGEKDILDNDSFNEYHIFNKFIDNIEVNYYFTNDNENKDIYVTARWETKDHEIDTIKYEKSELIADDDFFNDFAMSLAETIYGNIPLSNNKYINNIVQKIDKYIIMCILKYENIDFCGKKGYAYVDDLKVGVFEEIFYNKRYKSITLSRYEEKISIPNKRVNHVIFDYDNNTKETFDVFIDSISSYENYDEELCIYGEDKIIITSIPYDNTLKQDICKLYDSIKISSRSKEEVFNGLNLDTDLF